VLISCVSYSLKEKKERHPEAENNYLCWIHLSGLRSALLNKDQKDPISDTVFFCIFGTSDDEPEAK